VGKAGPPGHFLSFERVFVGLNGRRLYECPNWLHVGQSDHDRIIYSTAFLRLAGATQVVHSLKVARIGRGLAESPVVGQKEAAKAVNLDPDCVECAASAHDIDTAAAGDLLMDDVLIIFQRPAGDVLEVLTD